MARSIRPVSSSVDGMISRRSGAGLPAAARTLPAAPAPTVYKTPDPTAEVKKLSLPALAMAAAVEAPVPVRSAQPVATSRLPIDMELPGADSPSRFNLIRHVKWSGLRRGLAIAMVLVITLSGLVFSQSYLKLHKVFKGSAGTAAALKENVNPDLLKGEGSGRVNILLLGRGGGTHDGPDLTDTMIIASVDPVNHTATLLSLPRDLWVNVPNSGVMKLNSAWETGEFKYLGKQTPGSTNPKAIQAGYSLVDQTVQQVTGVTIDYNVLVDFQAFQQAVDTVGGVNVNVPADLVDPTMAWENKGNPVLAAAGSDSFSGQQALLYVRSRETTSDFARAERQRAVLTALKAKVETLGTLSNPVKLNGLLNTFGNNFQTDLSLGNANRLYSILRGVNNNSISSVGLNATTPGATQYVTEGNINGQSVVLPKAGLFQYADIQQFIRGQLKDPYLIRENARVEVLNGTDVPGQATAMADQLKSYGYNVVKVGNTPSTGWTTTTVVDLTNGKDKYTKHYLEQRYNVIATSHLNDTTIPTNGADFVIIIGSDEATPTQTAAH